MYMSDEHDEEGKAPDDNDQNPHCDFAVGFAAFVVITLPLWAAGARLIWEWFELGWRLFGLT